MYNNCVESIRKSDYCKKNLQGKLANITDERNPFKMCNVAKI